MRSTAQEVRVAMARRSSREPAEKMLMSTRLKTMRKRFLVDSIVMAADKKIEIYMMGLKKWLRRERLWDVRIWRKRNLGRRGSFICALPVLTSTIATIVAAPDAKFSVLHNS